METGAGLVGLEAGGGCAAKYSAALLEKLLAGYAPAASADLLVGLDPPDDAAVYRLDAERAVVLTTDFFPPMVDDPGAFGAIAAANALNDVFAMGGRPLVALSIAAFPEELPLDTVRAILDSAATKVAEAGAILAGGHTIRDSEPKYGLAVVGIVHPDAVWRKSGARPGDALLLTKRLGTGLVLAAAREGLLGEPELAAAVASMSTLDGAAAEALRPFEPNAVTDVTGFGLFGHGREVAERSGVRLLIEGERLPWLPGAREAARGGRAPPGAPRPPPPAPPPPGPPPPLPGAREAARAGLATGGASRNRDFAARALDPAPDSEEVAALGYDPQTAGGLLVCLPGERVAVLEAAFRSRGLFLARIGRVEAGSGVAVV